MKPWNQPLSIGLGINLIFALAGTAPTWGQSQSNPSTALSAITIKLQSEKLQMIKNDSSGTQTNLTYAPQGETELNWKSQFQIFDLAPEQADLNKEKTAEALAQIEKIASAEVQKSLAEKDQDRYAAALLMKTASGQSFYVDQFKTVNGFVESSLTRYFVSKQGPMAYRWVRRIPLPKSAGGRNATPAQLEQIQVMKFVERERQGRGDLILDFAKKPLPNQVVDDPLGLKPVAVKMPAKK